MSKAAHIIYLTVLTVIIFITSIILIYKGFSYYDTALDERFFHADHTSYKPSGVLGHGLGIIGSLFMIIGVLAYMLRKRRRIFSRLGVLQHWLEFHIFLCTLGPILVLFHTAFKFGGIVAVSFWSMVAVFLSGIVGRFIYIQIPRTIEGQELSLSEVRGMKSDISGILQESFLLDEESRRAIIESTTARVAVLDKNILVRTFKRYLNDVKTIRIVKSVIKKNNLTRTDQKKIAGLVKDEIKLNRRIERLVTMKNLFKYWHVAHLPFALVMLIIMVIHIAVTVAFGFKWIF